MIVDYSLDAHDRITEVGGDWTRFAAENGAPALTAEAVVGQPLQRFVEGSETWHLWELLLAAARDTGEPLGVPFRCDSPTQRRFMEMTISPARAGGLRLRARMLRVEDAPSTKTATLSRERWLRVCSWCRHVLVSGGRWVDPGCAVTELDLLGGSGARSLTGAVCPPCRALFEAKTRRPGAPPPRPGRTAGRSRRDARG